MFCRKMANSISCTVFPRQERLKQCTCNLPPFNAHITASRLMRFCLYLPLPESTSNPLFCASIILLSKILYISFSKDDISFPAGGCLSFSRLPYVIRAVVIYVSALFSFHAHVWALCIKNGRYFAAKMRHVVNPSPLYLSPFLSLLGVLIASSSASSCLSCCLH